MRKLLHPFSSQEVRQSLQQGRENLPALLEALTCYFQDAGFRVGALEPSEDEALHREWRECWEAERPLARAALARIAAGAPSLHQPHRAPPPPPAREGVQGREGAAGGPGGGGEGARQPA